MIILASLQTIHGETRAVQENAPQRSSAVVMTKFYLVSRMWPEEAKSQIERLHTSLTNAIAHHEKDGGRPSANLSITE